MWKELERTVERVDPEEKLILMDNMIEWVGDKVEGINRCVVLRKNDSGERIQELCASLGMSVADSLSDKNFHKYI